MQARAGRRAVITRGGIALSICVVALAAWTPVVGAEEAKTPVSAAMILSIVSQPVEPRMSAFDQAIRESARPPRGVECEGQPDGSVRCGSGPGSVAITVKNPCPPGTAHYAPPPLPGRRTRY